MSNIEEQIKQEPVQAIMTLIMRLCNNEQKKIIHEKLGRRVAPSPTDESALKDEAEELYPHPVETFSHGDTTMYSNENLYRRQGYLEGRRKTIEQKDGEIEGLKAEVAELQEKLRKTEEIAQIATEGLKEASKRIDELEEACKTYRQAYFKKVNGD